MVFLAFGQSDLLPTNGNTTPQPTSTNTPSSTLLIPSPTLPIYDKPTPQPHPDPNKTKITKEPYRVFFPTGADGKVVNNIVWLPEEFFRLLHQSIAESPQSKSENWKIESAEYVGKLNFNSITQTFEIAEFKAIYQIITESENATITLPALPLAASETTWDSIPIRATWQINSNNEPFNTKNDNKI
ncbi:MAG: hypothetical protein LBH59_07225, partial [Planctomycetaceae bacterium]|nr:hypothetical protein [Planctomycetaceae bacterium]